MPNVHVPWYPTTICGTHIYLPSHEITDQILVRSSFFFKNVEVKNATINPQINVLIVIKILFTTLSGNALIHCNILSPPRINVFSLYPCFLRNIFCRSIAFQIYYPFSTPINYQLFIAHFITHFCCSIANFFTIAPCYVHSSKYPLSAISSRFFIVSS